MVDAASYGLRVIYSAQGGVEIEHAGTAEGRLCPPHPGAVAEALAELISRRAGCMARSGCCDRQGNGDDAAGQRTGAGRDQSAVRRGIRLRGRRCQGGHRPERGRSAARSSPPLIAARPAIYADACRKIAEGFDYVELDPEGEIGLVTTGAGLSMMLIDELTARGAKPLNFCDIRTGQMRGSPARLIRVLEWITARPSLKAVLVNIFAGITDLGEFAGLLAAAIEASPALRVPVVARLVGRNAAEAKRILARGAARNAGDRGPGGSAGADRCDRGARRMIGSLSRTTPVIVQGITGRMGRSHAALMRAYGTNIVGGTSTRTDMPEAAGVPVFAFVRRGGAGDRRRSLPSPWRRPRKPGRRCRRRWRPG